MLLVNRLRDAHGRLKVERLRHAGESLAEIEAIVGVSKSSVHRIMRAPPNGQMVLDSCSGWEKRGGRHDCSSD